MSSAGAIVGLSRSKRRYHDQDALLQAFCGCDGYTAKEVAVEVLDWRYEQYANAPKRGFDLQRLGYLEQLDGRECRQTGKVAHTYKTTAKGREHLCKLGLVGTVAAAPVCDSIASDAGNAKRHLGSLRSMLAGI
jgi:hypothetical protein